LGQVVLLVLLLVLLVLLVEEASGKLEALASDPYQDKEVAPSVPRLLGAAVVATSLLSQILEGLLPGGGLSGPKEELDEAPQETIQDTAV